VRGRQPGGEGLAQVHRGVVAERPTPQARRQRLAFDVLQDLEQPAVLTHVDVQDAHDRGMVDLSQRRRLVQEAAHVLAVGGAAGAQRLHRHAPAGGQVVGQVHLSHGAGAQEGDHARPASQQRAGRQPRLPAVDRDAPERVVELARSLAHLGAELRVQRLQIARPADDLAHLVAHMRLELAVQAGERRLVLGEPAVRLGELAQRQEGA
jgi:hypothetical protein